MLNEKEIEDRLKEIDKTILIITNKGRLSSDDILNIVRFCGQKEALKRVLDR